MLVELDVFSGRVNPLWQLDAGQEQRVRALQQGLPERGEPMAEPPGLGYRGFRYTLDGVPWRAWNGAVAGRGRAFDDPRRTVERLLLELLPTEYAALRERITDELEKEN